jgi:DNA-binding MarR family transcriptional regulator
MKAVIETSRLNNNEKLVCIAILANDKISIVDMHNCLAMSMAMLTRICDMLLEYGYVSREQISVRARRKDVWVITDKLFQESESKDKTYYRENID